VSFAGVRHLTVPDPTDPTPLAAGRQPTSRNVRQGSLAETNRLPVPRSTTFTWPGVRTYAKPFATTNGPITAGIPGLSGGPKLGLELEIPKLKQIVSAGPRTGIAVSSTCGRPDARYSFSAPPTRPCTSQRWSPTTMMIGGRLARMDAAAMSPHGISNTPGKSASATGTVRLASLAVNV